MSNVSLFTLERHICCSCVQAQCQEVRKKKDLELQILTEPIRNWEGDDIRTLGPVLHMSQATVHTQNCQVLYSASKRLNRLPLNDFFLTVIESYDVGDYVKGAFTCACFSGAKRTLPRPLPSHSAHAVCQPEDERVHLSGT